MQEFFKVFFCGGKLFSLQNKKLKYIFFEWKFFFLFSLTKIYLRCFVCVFFMIWILEIEFSKVFDFFCIILPWIARIRREKGHFAGWFRKKTLPKHVQFLRSKWRLIKSYPLGSNYVTNFVHINKILTYYTHNKDEVCSFCWWFGFFGQKYVYQQFLCENSMENTIISNGNLWFQDNMFYEWSLRISVISII